MARPFDAATLALLDGESLVDRDLVVVSMPEGDFGYWSDVFNAEFAGTEYEGITFTGAASLIEVTPAGQTVADTVQTVGITLSGLATDVLSSVFAYNLHRATVRIARALYDPDTRALVSVVTWFRGYVDRDEIRETAQDDGQGGRIISSVLVLDCVSRARELDRATYRTREFSDQIRDYPGDRGFEFARKTGAQKIDWGPR